jgi:hypothetical protein
MKRAGATSSFTVPGFSGHLRSCGDPDVDRLVDREMAAVGDPHEGAVRTAVVAVQGCGTGAVAMQLATPTHRRGRIGERTSTKAHQVTIVP